MQNATYLVAFEAVLRGSASCDEIRRIVHSFGALGETHQNPQVWGQSHCLSARTDARAALSVLHDQARAQDRVDAPLAQVRSRCKLDSCVFADLEVNLRKETKLPVTLEAD